ncbi:hypothetical protein D3C78_1385640 [compost metagenome]
MKILASIIFGLIIGWSVVHADIFLPQYIKDFIGNGVAGNEKIKAITNLLATEKIPSRTIHFWILAFSLSAIQIFIISAISAFISNITKRSRTLICSCLIYPAGMALSSFYISKKVYISDPKIGAYLLSSAADQALLYIFSLIIFLIFFYSINVCADSLASRA